MPFQGKKQRLQKTIKFISCVAVIIAIAAGVHFQSQLVNANRPRKELRAKLAEEYSAAMLGKKLPGRINPVKRLDKELRRIKNVKSGQLSATGERSITAKLTLVLKAFNSCAAKTNLHIDKITVTTKNITITGNTSSRTNTLKLFDAIKKNNLDILQQRIDPKGGRDNFSATITVKT